MVGEQTETRNKQTNKGKQGERVGGSKRKHKEQHTNNTSKAKEHKQTNRKHTHSTFTPPLGLYVCANDTPS